jgi:lysophospholipase L1-like esterase
VIDATIVDHNQMAANVMREMNVPVNDLYAVLVNRRDLPLGDGFHWKPEGYDLLAREVIAAVDAALPAAAPPSAGR